MSAEETTTVELHPVLVDAPENPWDLMEAVWYDRKVAYLFHPSVPDSTLKNWLGVALGDDKILGNTPAEFIVQPAGEDTSQAIWRDLADIYRETDPNLAWSMIPADLTSQDNLPDLTAFWVSSKTQGWAKADLWVPYLFQHAEGLKVGHLWNAVEDGVIASLSPETLWWVLQEADSSMVERTLSAMQDIVLKGRSASNQLAASLFFLGTAGKNKAGGDRIWNSPEQVQRISKLKAKLADPLARHLEPSGDLVGLPFTMLLEVAVQSWAVDTTRPAWKALLEASPSR